MTDPKQRNGRNQDPNAETLVETGIDQEPDYSLQIDPDMEPLQHEFHEVPEYVFHASKRKKRRRDS